MRLEYDLGPLGRALIIGGRLIYLRERFDELRSPVFADFDGIYVPAKPKLAPAAQLAKLMALATGSYVGPRRRGSTVEGSRRAA